MHLELGKDLIYLKAMMISLKFLWINALKNISKVFKIKKLSKRGNNNIKILFNPAFKTVLIESNIDYLWESL